MISNTYCSPNTPIWLKYSQHYCTVPTINLSHNNSYTTCSTISTKWSVINYKYISSTIYGKASSLNYLPPPTIIKTNKKGITKTDIIQCKRVKEVISTQGLWMIVIVGICTGACICFYARRWEAWSSRLVSTPLNPSNHYCIISSGCLALMIMRKRRTTVINRYNYDNSNWPNSRVKDLMQY